MKEFAPTGANSLHLRADPFLEGFYHPSKHTGSLKSVVLLKKWQKKKNHTHTS